MSFCAVPATRQGRPLCFLMWRSKNVLITSDHYFNEKYEIFTHSFRIIQEINFFFFANKISSLNINVTDKHIHHWPLPVISQIPADGLIFPNSTKITRWYCLIYFLINSISKWPRYTTLHKIQPGCQTTHIDNTYR